MQERIEQADSVGVAADACIYIDATIKKDYIVLEYSQRAAGAMLEGGGSYLEGKGYQVEFRAPPFVGAFKDPNLTFRTAPKRGKKVTDQKAPFYWDQTAIPDAQTRDALVNIFRAVLKSIQTEVMTEKRSTPAPARVEGDIRRDCKLIRRAYGVDLLFVLMGNGKRVPGTKSFMERILTGLVTTIITLGHYTYERWHVSYISTYAGILDLRNGQVIWSNSLYYKDVNPTKKSFYLKGWPGSMLYHVPAKQEMK